LQEPEHSLAIVKLDGFGRIPNPPRPHRDWPRANSRPNNKKQCLRWLEGVPLLGKWAKIEGFYPSYSTLVILSMPISIWNMLPDHPPYIFIGYVTGPSLSLDVTEEEVSTRLLDRVANPSISSEPVSMVPRHIQSDSTTLHHRDRSNDSHTNSISTPTDNIYGYSVLLGGGIGL
jgi:hypothetical protein